jgi:hypothetical protein
MTERGASGDRRSMDLRFWGCRCWITHIDVSIRMRMPFELEGGDNLLPIRPGKASTNCLAVSELDQLENAGDGSSHPQARKTEEDPEARRHAGATRPVLAAMDDPFTILLVCCRFATPIYGSPPRRTAQPSTIPARHNGRWVPEASRGFAWGQAGAHAWSAPVMGSPYAAGRSVRRVLCF